MRLFFIPLGLALLALVLLVLWLMRPVPSSAVGGEETENTRNTTEETSPSHQPQQAAELSTRRSQEETLRSMHAERAIGQLVIRVSDSETSAPIAGASIRILAYGGGIEPSGERRFEVALPSALDPPAFDVLTDDEGIARLDLVPLGRYSVLADETSHLTARVDCVDVLLDDPQEIRIALTPRPWISGRVVGEQLAGIAGASVKLRREGVFSTIIEETFTDDMGDFAFCGSSGPVYSIAVQTPSGGRAVRNGVRAPCKDLEIRLVERGAIRGRLLDAQNGWPVKEARLFLSRGEASKRPWSHRNPSGEFRVEGLELGEWTITVHSPEHIPSPPTKVLLAAGQEPMIEIRLGHGATVEGTIRDHEGERIKGAFVHDAEFNESEDAPLLPLVARAARSQGGGPVASADEMGRFRLENLPPGARRLFAQAPFYLVTERLVVVADGEIAEIGDVILTKASSISGTISLADGRPLGFGTVSLQHSALHQPTPQESQDGEVSQRQDMQDIGENGTYAFHGLRQGIYAVTVIYRNEGLGLVQSHTIPDLRLGFEEAKRLDIRLP